MRGRYFAVYFPGCMAPERWPSAKIKTEKEGGGGSSGYSVIPTDERPAFINKKSGTKLNISHGLTVRVHL